MDSRYQFGATVVVWVAYACIMIALFLVMLFGRAELNSMMTMGPLLLFVMFLTSVTAYATRAIWHGAGTASASQTRSAAAQEARQPEGKAKRNQAERLQALIERLDEDEVIELETLLMSRGDEMLPSRRDRR